MKQQAKQAKQPVPYYVAPQASSVNSSLVHQVLAAAAAA